MEKDFFTTEIEECFYFLDVGDYQRAIEAGKKAVKAYPNEPKAYLCLGKAYLLTGELKHAFSSLLKARYLTQDKELLMQIFNLVGITLDNMGDTDGALEYFSETLRLAREMRKPFWEAEALNNIASVYYKKGDYNKALEYYNEALKLKGYEKLRGSIYSNIALIYDAKGEYQEALEYLQKAIDIYARYGNYHGSARTMINMGEIYRQVKNYEQAEKHLIEGLNRIKMVGNKYWEATAYGCLGLLYMDLNNKQKAARYLKQAYDLFKEIGAEKDAEVIDEFLIDLWMEEV